MYRLGTENDNARNTFIEFCGKLVLSIRELKKNSLVVAGVFFCVFSFFLKRTRMSVCDLMYIVHSVDIFVCAFGVRAWISCVWFLCGARDILRTHANTAFPNSLRRRNFLSKQHAKEANEKCLRILSKNVSLYWKKFSRAPTKVYFFR